MQLLVNSEGVSEVSLKYSDLSLRTCYKYVERNVIPLNAALYLISIGHTIQADVSPYKASKTLLRSKMRTRQQHQHLMQLS